MSILSDIGGFAERNAPTIGSIAGGIGGGVLGAVAAPFTGGVINPFDAGIAGASLLGGAGQAVKNASQGQAALQGNDVTTGVESGVGQALGDGVVAGAGKILGAVGSKIVPKVVNSGISDIVSKVTPAALKKLGNVVGINPALKTAMDTGIVHSADPTQLTTDDIEKMSSSGLPNFATGADGILSSTRDAIANKALDDSGRSIDLDEVRNMANDTAMKHGLSSDMTTNGAGGLPRLQGAGANAANYAMGVIRRASTTAEGAANLLKEADTLPGTNPLKGYYNEVGKNLQSQIYDSPEVKQGIADYKTTPEDKAAILKAVGGNEKFASHITDTLDNATSNKDIARAHSDLINVRALGDAAKQVASNTVQKAGGEAPSDSTGLQAAGHLLTGNPLKAAMTVGKNAIKSPEGVAKLSNVAKQGGDLLARMAKFTGPATAGASAATGSALAGQGMQDTANVTPTGGTMIPQAGAPGAAQPGNYPDLLSAMQAMAVLDPVQAGNASSILGSVLPGIQKSAAAAPLVGNAQAMASQPGVSGNPIDLILAKIPGTQQWAAAQAAQRAASALGTSSTFSPMAAPATNQAGLGALAQIPANIGY